MATGSSRPAPTKRPGSGIWKTPERQSGHWKRLPTTSRCVARFSPDGQLIAAADRQERPSVGRRPRATGAGTLIRRQGASLQCRFLSDRQPAARCGLRRRRRRFLCRTVGHRCWGRTGAVAGSDRSAQLPGHQKQWAGRCAGVFARRQDSGRRIRFKKNADHIAYSDSAEGLGGRLAPTDPPPE